MFTEPIDELTELVIGLAMRVHDALGPGLLESIYRDCLVLELVAAGLEVSVEHHVPVHYLGQKIRDDLRIDILVNGSLIIEIKAVERLIPVHRAQVLTYLKITGFPAALLFNFNDQHPSWHEPPRSSGHLRPKAAGTCRGEEGLTDDPDCLLFSWSPGLQ